MYEVENPETLQKMIEALFQRVSQLEYEMDILQGKKDK